MSLRGCFQTSPKKKSEDLWNKNLVGFQVSDLLDLPPPDASHHKDYSFFSSESLPKPSFSTVILGVDPTYLGQQCGDVNLMTLTSLHITSCQLADIFGARQPPHRGFVIPINLAELNHMSTTWMATFLGGGNFHLPSRSSTARP